MLLGQGEGFGHSLDGGPEQEVAGELDHVGGGGVIAEVEDAPAQYLLDRPYPRPCCGVARGHDPQRGADRHVGLAEDRRGDVAAAALAVGIRQPAGRPRRDRAHRQVDPGTQPVQEAVGTQGHLLDCGVVGHHGHDNAARQGRLLRAVREGGSTLQQGPALLDGPVVDAQVEACVEKVGRHGQAHATQADEADGLFHYGVLLLIASARRPVVNG
jgi:hypothetical protein